jgi:hypothetical protein
MTETKQIVDTMDQGQIKTIDEPTMDVVRQEDMSVKLLDVISKAASDPNVDIDKMERLMGMHERMVSKQAEMQFNKAMSKAQTDMRRVVADARNPQTHSTYASYAALDKSLRPIYTKHGFALSFDTEEGAPPEFVRVVCYVSHEDGFSKKYRIDMPADGKGAKGGDVMTKTHATGSAMSYGMRYLLKMIFNVAVSEDDDDGNAAGVEPVTEEQAANIEALLTEVGADKALFLQWAADSESIEAIPANWYDSCIRALERKRGEQ